MMRSIFTSGWCRGGRHFFGAALMLMVAGPGVADPLMPRQSRPDDAQIYFITPGEAEVLTSPIVVRFGLKGMGIAPAGVEKSGTGHHHLIIDAELPPAGLPIPASDHHRHFGKGQTEVTLELAPGEHTLQLLLGDHFHIPHDPPLASQRISIVIEP
ncbi:MAG: DUF4399 domain-containing protein [Myxococcota bacterium]